MKSSRPGSPRILVASLVLSVLSVRAAGSATTAVSAGVQTRAARSLLDSAETVMCRWRALRRRARRPNRRRGRRGRSADREVQSAEPTRKRIGCRQRDEDVHSQSAHLRAPPSSCGSLASEPSPDQPTRPQGRGASVDLYDLRGQITESVGEIGEPTGRCRRHHDQGGPGARLIAFQARSFVAGIRDRPRVTSSGCLWTLWSAATPFLAVLDSVLRAGGGADDD